MGTALFSEEEGWNLSGMILGSCLIATFLETDGTINVGIHTVPVELRWFL